MISNSQSGIAAIIEKRRQCGPAFFLSLLAVILVALLALVFFGHAGDTSGHKPVGRSIPEKLSSEAK